MGCGLVRSHLLPCKNGCRCWQGASALSKLPSISRWAGFWLMLACTCNSLEYSQSPLNAVHPGRVDPSLPDWLVHGRHLPLFIGINALRILFRKSSLFRDPCWPVCVFAALCISWETLTRVIHVIVQGNQTYRASRLFGSDEPLHEMHA